MKKIKCKNFKHNHFYYAPEVDTIFLVTINHTGTDGIITNTFYILEWTDKNDVPEMRSFTYGEIKHDEFYGIELGEL